MPLKPRRLQRKNMLLRSGFLPFEAQEFSRVPLDAPYIKDMIKERRSAFEEAIRYGLSKQAWKEVVYDVYFSRGMTKVKYGREIPDPWKNMRRWEEIGRTKYPEYESPSSKVPRVKKTSKEFQSKYNMGEEKYPRGRAYPDRRS